MGGEVFVGAAEVLVTEESVVGRQGRRMGRSQYQMAVAVDEGAFPLGVCSPEDEYQVFFLLGQHSDGSVGKGLPAVILVRSGLMGAYGQRSVQQEDALLCPAGQVAAGGHVGADVTFDFLENVDQRGRKGYAVVHRKAEAVGLSRAMVRVLPDDDHLYAVEGAEVEGIEYQPARRVDGAFGIFIPHEVGQCLEVFFVEFGLQAFLPALFYLNIHGFRCAHYGLDFSLQNNADFCT